MAVLCIWLCAWLINTAAAAPGGADAWRESAPPVGTVTVYRDNWGVPHLQARREEDGFYGLGYAIAQDDLEDTLRQHVIGRGEVARFFGARYLEIDRQYALLDVHAQALAGLARLPRQLRRNLDAYVEGFNRYLDEHPGERPSWAQGLRPEAVDLIGFSQLFTLMFPVNVMQGAGDCRRGGVEVPATYPMFINLLRTGGPADASTGWAVSPWRTAVKGAIHLADPHNLIDVPSPEFRIHAGDFEFSGFMVGLLFTGHSRHVAWGTTFGSPDVADCYAIKTEAGNPNAYQVEGREFPIRSKVVSIAVKGGAPQTVNIEYTIINGIRAPIVARRNDVAYAVVTPYADRAEGSLVDLYNMARAKDLYAMRAALDDQGLFPVGLTTADSSGNIGYFRIGRTPRRDDAIDWTRPVSGNERATLWQGAIHPFRDLVQVINPIQGYVRETNLAATTMWSGDNYFHPPAYARYILGDTPEVNGLASPMSRGRLVDDLLSRTLHMSDAEAVSYVFEEKWSHVPHWQRALMNATAHGAAYGRNLSDPEQEILRRVLRFNGEAHAESIDALAFHYWQDGVSAAAAADKVDRAALATRVHGDTPDPADEEVLLAGVQRAAQLMESLKQWNARYGDVFRFGRGGQTYPIGGCTTPFEATLHTTECTAPGTAVRLAVAGQKQIMLTVFGDPLRSYSWAAYGQQWRNRPNDPHFNDQSRLTSVHQLKPTLFERSELLEHLESSVTLSRRGSH